MEMDAIKNAGMTYQGSVSAADKKVENQPQADAAGQTEGSDVLTKNAQEIRQAEDGAENTSQNVDPRNPQIRKAVDEVNKKAVNSEAIFGIHEATNRVTIKIIDKDSKKVIKEIPPEKTLDMIAKVWELAGLMVDEKG